MKQIMTGKTMSDHQEQSNKYRGLAFSIAKEEVNALSKVLILRFMANHSSELDLQMQIITKGSTMLKLFRYPNITYLTSTTFSQLGKCMAGVTKKINSGHSLSLTDIHEIRDLLKIVKTNFAALNYCQIHVTHLYLQSSDYSQFVADF